jgi:two-component system cell cycle response regulator DivK
MTEQADGGRGEGGVRGRVLVIEDNPENSRLAEKILTKSGYDCIISATAMDGLARLASEPIDVVLLDMSLPGMDGWEAVGIMKADPRISGIPVIALTAHAMDEHRERALEAGCDAFMAKPFRPAELIALIRKTLNE